MLIQVEMFEKLQAFSEFLCHFQKMSKLENKQIEFGISSISNVLMKLITSLYFQPSEDIIKIFSMIKYPSKYNFIGLLLIKKVDFEPEPESKGLKITLRLPKQNIKISHTHVR